MEITSSLLKISVCVIAFNEQSNIEDCLASVEFASDKVVFDSGSTDATQSIAQAAGAKVYVNTQWPGFGPQKNLALSKASHDWVLSIDADERCTPELAAELETALAAAHDSGTPVAFAIPRLTQFCGVWIRHCGWTPDYVVRVFRRSEAQFSDDLVHEKVIFKRTDVQVVKLKNTLLHYSYPSPEQYWRKLELYSKAWAKQKHAEGRKVTIVRAGLSALVAFVRSYVFRLGFLDGAMGFAVCTMQAQAAFGKYFELYCLNKKHETR
jgi:glycosyltransferase involved in cell wall biosynthesis